MFTCVFIDPKERKAQQLLSQQHLGVSYVRAKTALIDKANEPGGALEYLNLTSTGSYMFQDSLYAFQTLMGDAFIVSTIPVLLVSGKYG